MAAVGSSEPHGTVTGAINAVLQSKLQFNVDGSVKTDVLALNAFFKLLALMDKAVKEQRACDALKGDVIKQSELELALVPIRDLNVPVRPPAIEMTSQWPFLDTAPSPLPVLTDHCSHTADSLDTDDTASTGLEKLNVEWGFEYVGTGAGDIRISKAPPLQSQTQHSIQPSSDQ